LRSSRVSPVTPAAIAAGLRTVLVKLVTDPA